MGNRTIQALQDQIDWRWVASSVRKEESCDALGNGGQGLGAGEVIQAVDYFRTAFLRKGGLGVVWGSSFWSGLGLGRVGRSEDVSKSMSELISCWKQAMASDLPGSKASIGRAYPNETGSGITEPDFRSSFALSVLMFLRNSLFPLVRVYKVDILPP